MSEPNDGGPAFPVEVGTRPIGQNWHQTGPDAAQHYGMSLRDHFAGVALAAMLANPDKDHSSRGKAGLKKFPGYAYEWADAMLRARTTGAPNA